MVADLGAWLEFTRWALSISISSSFLINVLTTVYVSSQDFSSSSSGTPTILMLLFRLDCFFLLFQFYQLSLSGIIFG